MAKMFHLALIGVGAWGKNYISTINSFPNCNIKYICTRSGNIQAKPDNEYIAVKNYRDLLSITDIDGIIIATPNASHYEIAQFFLKKGYPLLVEKPFLENYNQAKNIKSFLTNKTAKILVGHTYLFDPAYIKAKKIVQEIGPIRYITYEGTNNGPYRDKTSTLWDVGPHAISLCLDVYQKNPVKLSAWAVDSLRPNNNYYDFSFIKITFEDQTEAYIKISWLFPFKKRELVIVGQKQSVVYDAVANKKVLYFKNMISIGKGKKVTTNSVIYPPYNKSTPLEVEVQEFLDIIANKSTNKYSNLALGIKVTQLLHLAEKSIKLDGKAMSVIK
jgi:predicted dehydrogenase